MRSLVALGVVLAMAGCGILHCLPLPGTETEMVLRDIQAGAKPSDLKSRTDAPSRSGIAYEIDERSHEADLYRPAGRIDAGLVMMPGASPAGRDDPRLVAFATSLARARYAVLVPEMPAVRELRVKPSDGRDLADAFAYLKTRPELTPGGRAGIGATSYAVGPAVMAAMEPDVRDDVRFLLAVGGYYDLERVVTFFTTGYFKEQTDSTGEWKYQDPGDWGKWVFLLSYVDRLEDAADRKTIKAMADRKLKDAKADVEDLRTVLNTEGKSIDALLQNRDPEKVPGLIANLPKPARDDMAALNLKGKDLSGFKARPILVHGYDDTVVPYTESVALSRALASRSPQLYLANGLSHVDFKEPGFFDVWNLYCAVDALLAERTR